MDKNIARNLINAGVHFGHSVSRWNPKMKPFIFAKRGTIHIINVRETLKGILLAQKLLMQITSSGKDVIFVGTKRQSQKSVEATAKACDMHYVSTRWLGGMLTNFRTIRSRLKRLEQLEAMAEAGTLEQESKKQATRLKREMRKIDSNLGGVRKMSRMPGAVVAVDVKKEHLALQEAKKLGIPTVGIIDTNSDPDNVDIAIPANDDSIRAIELILGELADAVAKGKTMYTPAPTAPPVQTRSKRRTLARAEKPKEQSQPQAVTESKPAETKEEQPEPAPVAPEENAPEDK